MVEDVLASKGMIVTHKTIRLLDKKIGQDIAKKGLPADTPSWRQVGQGSPWALTNLLPIAL